MKQLKHMLQLKQLKHMKDLRQDDATKLTQQDYSARGESLGLLNDDATNPTHQRSLPQRSQMREHKQRWRKLGDVALYEDREAAGKRPTARGSIGAHKVQPAFTAAELPAPLGSAMTLGPDEGPASDVELLAAVIAARCSISDYPAQAAPIAAALLAAASASAGITVAPARSWEPDAEAEVEVAAAAASADAEAKAAVFLGAVFLAAAASKKMAAARASAIVAAVFLAAEAEAVGDMSAASANAEMAAGSACAEAPAIRRTLYALERGLLVRLQFPRHP